MLDELYKESEREGVNSAANARPDQREIGRGNFFKVEITGAGSEDICTW